MYIYMIIILNPFSNMRKRVFTAIGILLCSTTLMLSGCSREFSAVAQPATMSTSTANYLKSTALSLSETFESGSKSAYATANVSLSSGSWSFNDALIGNSTSDIKEGLQSARIRNTGKLTMLFDKAGGAGTITVAHAKFGSDASSTWELWISTSAGNSWSKVGNTVTTSGTTLSTATFTANVEGNIRIEIRKTGGASNRINIDNISISDYSSVTPPDPGTTFVEDGNMAFGNPSGAIASILSPDNNLMVKPQYAMAYSNSKLTPIWTSWHVTSSDLGSTPRQDDFRPDTTLPSSWYHCVASEYSGSGFDRGHMCPSADRTSSVANNSATFLMTNMIPQAPNNNQITWANLENYTRSLVNAGNEVYIISGPYGQGGTGSNGARSTVGNGVVVPSKTWKIILVLPQGSNDLSRVTTATRVIAVLMPNDQTCNTLPWGSYRVSVDSLETLTGFDFFSLIPSSIQSAIESRVDNGPTN